jgi:hypothetical protein
MVFTNLVHDKGIVYTNFKRECYWYVNRIVRVLALHAKGLGHPARIYIRETEEAAVADSPDRSETCKRIVKLRQNAKATSQLLMDPIKQMKDEFIVPVCS